MTYLAVPVIVVLMPNPPEVRTAQRKSYRLQWYVDRRRVWSVRVKGRFEIARGVTPCEPFWLGRRRGA